MPAVLRLASASPRRAALLTAAGIPFRPGPVPEVDETPPAGASPSEVVVALARAKAVAAHARAPEDWVLSADTLVFLDGDALGKPRDDPHAVALLTRLSGRAHEVWTGMALHGPAGGPGCRVVAARTTVAFRALTDAEVRAYVATGEPRGKAGAYALQGGAAAFVASLEGDRDTVIGLSIRAVRGLLAEAGLAL